MSLFVTINRFASIPRLVRVRAFATSIGLNQTGGIVVGNPEVPLITIFRQLDTFSVQAESSTVFIDGNPLLCGLPRTIKSGDKLTINDFEFNFHLGHSWAEHTPLNDPLTTPTLRGYLEYSIAHMLQRVPITDGVYSIGAHEEDNITIPLAGVEPTHMKYVAHQDHIELYTHNGSFSLAGVKVAGPVSLRLNETFTIEPIGLRISIISARYRAPTTLSSDAQLARNLND